MTDAKSRRRRRDPPSTRAAILAAARQIMSERGPAGMTLSDVARRAGVNRGTAYQHFATREAVIAAVLEETFGSTHTRLAADAPGGLDARIDYTVRYLVDHPELIRLAMFRILAGAPNPREDLWAGYREQVAGLMRSSGRRAADADMLAIILLGASLLWALRVQSGAEPASATDRYLHELKRVMLYGVIQPERHPELVRAVAGRAGTSASKVHSQAPKRPARRLGRAR